MQAANYSSEYIYEKLHGNEGDRISFIKLPEVKAAVSRDDVYAEKFNAYSHFAGLVFGVFILGWTLSSVCLNMSAAGLISALVYSLSVILLYAMSGIYHYLPAGTAKRIFRVFDHCTIFVLIAGCYTPFCLLCFWNYPTGRIMLCLEWLLAAAGIAMNLRDMSSAFVKTFSQICYVAMGWMVVLAAGLLSLKLSKTCIVLLAVGGICYTVGIAFYALGKKFPVMHCVWHVFVLLGSIFQFASISMIY